MKDNFLNRLRLRWLTLAEIVGVAALLIAGLGYWDSHRERTQEDRERAAARAERQAEAKAQVLKASFLMIAEPEEDGARLRLASANPDQVIQTQTLWFPAQIRRAPAETTGNPRLQSEWLESGLRKTDLRRGRLPVVVQTVYVADGQTRTDRALYFVGFNLKSRLLRPARLELEGLSLSRRDVAGDPQAAADEAWAVKPALRK
ncbi:hypothetical protein QO010_004052 [Caulobacter ginsengisoli]|uniref:Uncharacterized protein n=1 Tax=Caulobacter ginsengisoli TaxID=400775 RepID=A0ABU0IYX9_9CAUL|nr:hypothetical protein [Caulobacter ginsengisoli]MDQ0466259.1 hypothetical protein [Caulobacter ginsengisoli]